jgi:carbamoyl-phosphate synthase large subunit
MNILSLGGGPWQVELIKVLNNMGANSYVVDRDPDCICRSLAFTYIQADPLDRATLATIVEQHSINIVIAEQSDRFVTSAAYLNTRYNLPGMTLQVAEKFTNKSLMREILRGVVPAPEFQSIRSPEEGIKFCEINNYPVIIKPKSSQSSSGVYLIKNADQLFEKYQYSIQFSDDGEILIEKFIDGIELTVEGLVVDQEFHLLAVSKKTHYRENPCVAKSLSYSKDMDPILLSKLYEINSKIINNLQLKNGLTHAEFRVMDDIPYLIEIAARGGGTNIAGKILPHVAGFNVYELLIRKLIGEDIKIPRIENNVASLVFLDFPPGMVKKIHGQKEVLVTGLCNELKLNFSVGDYISSPEDDTKRLGYALILGRDAHDVDKKCKKIEEIIHVEYE